MSISLRTGILAAGRRTPAAPLIYPKVAGRRSGGTS